MNKTTKLICLLLLTCTFSVLGLGEDLEASSPKQIYALQAQADQDVEETAMIYFSATAKLLEKDKTWKVVEKFAYIANLFQITRYERRQTLRPPFGRTTNYVEVPKYIQPQAVFLAVVQNSENQYRKIGVTQKIYDTLVVGQLFTEGPGIIIPPIYQQLALIGSSPVM